MNIQDAICPLCGNPSPEGEICGRCRVGKTPWLECQSRVSPIECPSCGARKEAGSWTDHSRPRDDLARELALRGIRLHPQVRNPRFSITLDEHSVNRTRATCHVEGVLFGEEVEGDCTVEIAWKKEQCDRCSRISGSYHEGVVQVRASGRKPSPREIATTSRIAQEVEDSLQASGERLSFISDLQETRDGVDITVGSQRIGQEIATAVTRALGGRCSTHPKLVGEKAGRQLYRITYSVRLPRFTRGDIVLIHGKYGEVLAAEGKGIRYLDLATNAVKTASESLVERLAGNARDAPEWLVAFRDGDTAGILDPETGATLEVKVPAARDLVQGSLVRVFRDGECLVLLG
ncbi:MAG: 60S ribosomal export protein NMD3 [Methanolinea sp.]|nr:60S ribosomal export protein NMD3 [Methanolinea sp.]